jgi:surface antigen
VRAAGEAPALSRLVSRLLISAAVLGLAAGPAAPVAAVTTQPAPPAAQAAQSALAYQQAQRDLGAAQASLARLDGQLQEAQRQVAAADELAAQDAQHEEALRQRIGEMARSAYQTEGSQLSGLLEAHSVAELWDALAEARLVSERQHDALDQLDRVRRTDERALGEARAHEGDVSRQRRDAQAQIGALQSRLSGLAAVVQAAGQVIAGAAGRVPAQRLPQTTGVDGQCTWYAEQAWAAWSDPGSPVLTGNGGEVVANLARATGRGPDPEPQPGSLVSWRAPLMSGYGHVAYVAGVDRDAAGNLTGYTVWEMNYQGPFVTDVRHVTWSGPSAGVQFLSPAHPVDPIAAAAAAA